MSQVCEALPRDGRKHGGPAGEYVRLCPAGHTRFGSACRACAGTGAVLCTECPPDSPAILIAAAVFSGIVHEEWPHRDRSDRLMSLVLASCACGSCKSYMVATINDLLRPAVRMAQPSIACPSCGKTSYNPTDVSERFCGNCHLFHNQMPGQRA
jgi:hypothetical protein